MKSRLRIFLAILILGGIAAEVASNVVGVEAGFRHQLTPRFVLDAGIGTEFAGPTDRSKFFFTTGISFGF